MSVGDPLHLSRGRLPEETWCGYKQPGERKQDENDLVNVILTRGQTSDQVGQPEHRVEPQHHPRPPLPTTERDHGDHGAEQAHPGQGHAIGSQERVATEGRSNTEPEDAEADDQEADPAGSQGERTWWHPGTVVRQNTRGLRRQAHTRVTDKADATRVHTPSPSMSDAGHSRRGRGPTDGALETAVGHQKVRMPLPVRPILPMKAPHYPVRRSKGRLGSTLIARSRPQERRRPPC